MLEDLLSFLQGPSHPDDTFVRLDSLRFDGNDGLFELSVMDYDCQEVWARWRVCAREVRECSIGRSGGDLLLLHSDHVVVRQHTEPREELYFHGLPASVSEVVGQLWQTHRHTAQDWIPFRRFLNSHVSLDKLLAGKHGLLADGPTFLTEVYAAVLTSYDMAPNSLGRRPPKWWNGRAWLENPDELAAFTIGDSLVVARALEEGRIEGSAG